MPRAPAGYAMSAGSSREAMHAAVDVDHLARDVARERRGEERDQIRHVLGLAEEADRDVRVDERSAIFRCRMQPLKDLLAVDPAGRQAVDR